MDVSSAFRFAPIQNLHRARTRRIRNITAPAPPPVTASATGVSEAAEYALSHHVLEGAEAAARSHDTAAFDWYATHPDANASALATPAAVATRVILAPDLAGLPRSAISETPYYVLGPDTAAAPRGLQDLADTAFAIGAETGFADLLDAHAVVVCLLRHKSLGDTLDSWTITRLPGTVFCDHVGDPVVLARDLVHEAGHNWLNDAFTSTGSKISEEAQFFSPWKKIMRPAFGFLHACWAFPLTMICTARILDSTTGDLRGLLTAYLERQRGLLAGTVQDHAQALSLVSDADLRNRLHAVHQEALRQ